MKRGLRTLFITISCLTLTGILTQHFLKPKPPPIKTIQPSHPNEKFLSYFPHGDFITQYFSLQQAIRISRITNRTLILPQLQLTFTNPGTFHTLQTQYEKPNIHRTLWSHLFQLPPSGLIERIDHQWGPTEVIGLEPHQLLILDPDPSLTITSQMLRGLSNVTYLMLGSLQAGLRYRLEGKRQELKVTERLRGLVEEMVGVMGRYEVWKVEGWTDGMVEERIGELRIDQAVALGLGPTLEGLEECVRYQRRDGSYPVIYVARGMGKENRVWQKLLPCAVLKEDVYRVLGWVSPLKDWVPGGNEEEELEDVLDFLIAKEADSFFEMPVTKFTRMLSVD